MGKRGLVSVPGSVACMSSKQTTCLGLPEPLFNWPIQIRAAATSSDGWSTWNRPSCGCWSISFVRVCHVWCTGWRGSTDRQKLARLLARSLTRTPDLTASVWSAGFGWCQHTQSLLGHSIKSIDSIDQIPPTCPIPSFILDLDHDRMGLPNVAVGTSTGLDKV